MTLTIELTLFEEARLASVATQEGVAPAEAAHKVLTAHLPSLPNSENERIKNEAGAEQASAFGKAKAERFLRWAESHSRETPLLTDDEISRESLYGGNETKRLGK